MTNKISITNNQIPKRNKYDLEFRTTEFSVRCLHCIALIQQTQIVKPIIDQLIRCATSIGANYREANASDTRKDFKNKLSICKKEARETMYWFELLQKGNWRNTSFKV